jgi:uncharacterized protein (DUF885 family)
MGKLESEALGRLVVDYWQQRLGDEPLMATALGERRYDGRLPDISPEGRAAIRRRYEEVVLRCETIAEDALAPPERLTRTALLVDARSQIDYGLCDLDDWTVDPLGGPQVQLMNVESFQPVRTADEGRTVAGNRAVHGTAHG